MSAPAKTGTSKQKKTHTRRRGRTPIAPGRATAPTALRKSWDQRLPRFAWALMDDGGIAIFDARLPVFWLRRVAQRYNVERLNGTGTIIRVWVKARDAQ